MKRQFDTKIIVDKKPGLAAGMHRKQGRYYYGQNDLALGADLVVALRRWAELRGERLHRDIPTLADAIREYRRVELPQKRPKTHKDYGPQLMLLDKVFGKMALSEITPADVKGSEPRKSCLGIRR